MRHVDVQELQTLVRPYVKKQNSVSWIFSCPRCNKKDKLYLRKRDGRFVCFVCKETSEYYGSAEYFLTDLLTMPITELQKRLYGMQVQGSTHLELKLRDFFGDGDDDTELLDVEPMLPLILPPDSAPLTSRSGAKGAAYMEKRGIPLEVSAQYDLTYWASKQRVIFPIYLDGSVYGYQARTIVNAEPKILGSKGLKRDRLVMFSQRITGDHAVVCEGPIDALKAHLCGGNVATMGKAVSSKQIELLRSKGVRKLYLALDPDAAGETAKLVKDNWQDFEVYQMEVPHPYKDFGEMSFGEVRDCFDAAKRANPAKLFLYLKKPSF